MSDPRRWPVAARLAGLVLALAAVGGCSAGAVEVPTERPPADIFLAPDGHDEDACLAESPCLTLQRGYEVATPGEVVELAAGEYPAQEIAAGEAADEGPDVLFRPAEGAAVSFADQLQIYASGIELRDMAFTWYVHPGAARVTLQDIVAPGSNFITSARQVRVIGGEIGPGDSTDGLQIKRAQGQPNPRDILIDGVYVHDFTRVEDPTHHTDCVQVGAGVDLTIRNSRFDNCATQGVFFSTFGGGAITNLVVENNWFGAVPEGFYALVLEEVEGALVRFNSSTYGFSFRAERGLAGARVVANVGPYRSYACADGVVYERNVWTEAACSPTDLAAPSGFVDAAAFDLRLAPGAAAIDRGDPDDFPATDILGQPRPLGAAPDAGAHEVS